MKAIILISIFAAFLSIANLLAGEPKAKIYTNHQTTKSGVVKEYTYFENDFITPQKQFVYYYDVLGNMQKKECYRWGGKDGWIAIQKHEYSYDSDGRLAIMSYSKWDIKQEAWSANSQNLVYEYNENGVLMAVN